MTACALLAREASTGIFSLICNWIYIARLVRRGDNKGRIVEMNATNNHIHSRRAASGITLFRRAVMAGLLASTLLTALPSITLADGDGNKGKHSLIQQPYGLKNKSPFATTFVTMATVQAAIDALEATTMDLKAQVDRLTIANTKLTEDYMKLNNALGTAQTDVSAIKVSVEALDKKTADIIPDLGKYLKVDTTNVFNGVAGPHILFTGVNVHVRSGSGATNNNSAPHTGLGNLIIGYNENTTPTPTLPRAGSHNLVGGSMNAFSSVGGMVFGLQNTISGQYASVLGGNGNTAAGSNSTVYGGLNNMAVNQNSYAPIQGRPTPGQ